MARHSKSKEHFAQMVRHTMETDAWRGLSSVAQALYPWLRLQWKGSSRNNNGKIQFSNRQAAKCLGVSINTASRAFHNLQKKGFLHITEGARLGVCGDAKSPSYELTELSLPGKGIAPRKLYLEWCKGKDFPVSKAMANNPTGRNGQENKDDKVVPFNTRRAGEK